MTKKSDIIIPTVTFLAGFLIAKGICKKSLKTQQEYYENPVLQLPPGTILNGSQRLARTLRSIR